MSKYSYDADISAEDKISAAIGIPVFAVYINMPPYYYSVSTPAADTFRKVIDWLRALRPRPMRFSYNYPNLTAMWLCDSRIDASPSTHGYRVYHRTILARAGITPCGKVVPVNISGRRFVAYVYGNLPGMSPEEFAELTCDDVYYTHALCGASELQLCCGELGIPYDICGEIELAMLPLR